MNYSISDGGVCRTAPPTPGLLSIFTKIHVFKRVDFYLPRSVGIEVKSNKLLYYNIYNMSMSKYVSAVKSPPTHTHWV